MIAAIAIKRVGIVVALAAGVGIASMIALPFLIPAQRVREAVAADIRSVTGLDPVLRGSASVSLLPSGRVSFDNVMLEDRHTGMAALTADRVIARLRYFPLLLGRVEIADISLVRPTIAVIVNADGSSNWSGQVELLAQNLKPGAESRPSFSEIRIEDGTIVVRHADGRTIKTLSEVDLALAWPSFSKTFAATGRFSWNGKPMDTAISFTDFIAALQGESSGFKLRLSGEPFNLAFDGHLSSRPTLKIDGILAADTASLRDALRWAGHPPPAGGGLGRFALKAQSSVVGTTVGLSGMHLELDDNSAEGVLTFDGRRTLQGTLAAEGLDLTQYASTARRVTAREGGWDNSPIALDLLEGPDVDLRLSAASIKLGNAKLGRTATAVNLRGGSLTVAIGQSEAFGGVITGSLGMAKSPAGADVRAELQFSNIDLEQCLSEMFGIRRLEGKGHLGLSINGSGGSIYAVTKALNGSAGLHSDHGALVGFNVEQLLRRVERRPLSVGSELRTGRTPYDLLTVDLKIAQGIVSVEQARVEGPAITLGLTGSASIPARELDLKGTASLLSNGGNAAAPAFELPFMVQGPWDDPDTLLDPQFLIRRSGAAAPLLDAVRKNGAREVVRSAIERLTGAAPSAPQASGVPSLAGSSVSIESATPAAQSDTDRGPASDAPPGGR